MKLVKQVRLLKLNSSSFKCFDKRKYFAEKVGYKIPFFLYRVLFIAVLSDLAALISAVQWRGRGGGFSTQLAAHTSQPVSTATE